VPRADIHEVQLSDNDCQLNIDEWPHARKCILFFYSAFSRWLELMLDPVSRSAFHALASSRVFRVKLRCPQAPAKYIETILRDRKADF
jgi:hypothetical protein